MKINKFLKCGAGLFTAAYGAKKIWDSVNEKSVYSKNISTNIEEPRVTTRDYSKDNIDLSSDDSFPASDPPSRGGSQGVGHTEDHN